LKTAINVGSGQRPFTTTPEIEWVNVDKIAHDGMPLPDVLCDGANLPYADGAADYFVLHHVVEHFGCGEAGGLIREAHRVLKPSGSLFVFVPDLKALAERWLAGGLSTQIYATNLYGAYMGHEEDRHKWGFDSGSLDEFLKASADWSEVKPFDWRPIPGADIARDFWILGAECVR
jgi:SAM-dependent methyltransferase